MSICVPNTSPTASSTAPTVTNKTGGAIAFGSATTVTFTNGVSTAGGSMVLYKKENASIGVTDSTISEGSTLAVNVAAAATNHVTITSSSAGLISYSARS